VSGAEGGGRPSSQHAASASGAAPAQSTRTASGVAGYSPGATRTTAAQIQNAVAVAAVGLLQAGVHEGRLKLNPREACLAAAAVYQIVHGQASMAALMTEAAERVQVRDEYARLIGSPLP
jgi:hypothetical protein